MDVFVFRVIALVSVRTTVLSLKTQVPPTQVGDPAIPKPESNYSGNFTVRVLAAGTLVSVLKVNT